MSYTNVYPSRINWENEPSIASPINATNLNKMDYALYQHDQTLETWDVTKANQSDLLLSVKSIDYNTSTGVFVFTWQNGTTKTVDLNIEKIPVSFSMSAQGVITMTTDDGTQYTADVGSLIKTYTFTDSTEIDFTVTTDQSGNKTVTAALKDGSIVGSKLEPNYLANCQSAANSASASKTAAEGSAEDAEAWAVGERDGVPVPSTDPAYNNNSKYWAEHTTSSFAGLTDTSITNPQNGQVPVYNSSTNKWENADQSAGGGSTIKITTPESALYGRTVTITCGTYTESGTFSNSGEAEFTGVTATGTFTIATSTSGGTSVSKSLSVPYFGNYSTTITLFSATITATFPADRGATCTCDGVTASTSPYTFTVGAAGTYPVQATLDGASKSVSVPITTDGQSESVTLSYGTINLTFSNEFRGLTITCGLNGTTITKQAPGSGNTMAFYPPTTGEWTISGTYSGVTYTTTTTVSSLSTPVSAILQTIPDGSTVTPTDVIQTWLKCAAITDKSYTSLAEVLNDTDTFTALLQDSNACDYMARSTTWAVATGLVPTMTSNTTPSGECICSSYYHDDDTYNAYRAFDNDATTKWADNSMSSGEYVGYSFPEARVINKVEITTYPSLTTANRSTIIVKAGNTLNDLQTIATLTDCPITANTTYTKEFENTNAYKIYVLVDGVGGTEYWNIIKIQFYAADITNNADAMARIGKYDYCSSKLIGNEDWADAIINSDYIDYIFTYERGFVPTMTSNTTPSGEASAKSILTSGSEAFRAFDNTDTTQWHSAAGAEQWIIYESSTPICVKAVVLKNSNVSGIKTSTFKGSNDGINWTDIGTFVDSPTPYRVYGKSYSDNNTSYKYHGLFITASNYVWEGNHYSVMASLQFYGKEPQTNIIHSAASDTLYYIDGTSQTIGTTDTSGVGTVDWSNVPVGNLTIYSSVAHDPDDLTSAYSKTVRITPHTTEVWVMPDNALYWYGYIEDSFKARTDNSEVSHVYPAVAPTFNANSISIYTTGNSQLSAMFSKSIPTGATGITIVYQGVNAVGGAYGNLRILNNTNLDDGSNISIRLTSSSLATLSNINTPTVGMCTDAYDGTKFNLYATMWI